MKTPVRTVCRSAVIIVIVMAPFLFLAYDAIATRVELSRSLDRCAGRWVAMLVIDYMQAKSQSSLSLPASWEDLRPSFWRVDALVTGTRFEDLQVRVRVVWGLSAESVMQGEPMLFPRQGASFGSEDPNSFIIRALQSYRAASQPATGIGRAGERLGTPY
jgi:hypothetical protein